MTGNPILDKLIFFFNGLGILMLLSILVYRDFIYESPLLEDQIEFNVMTNAAKKMAFTDTYKVEKLIINLHSRSTRLRFLDVEMHLFPFKEHDVERLQANDSIIKDLIIQTAGKMTPEEVNSISGKILLEERIKKAINQAFKKAVVNKIYFTVFVIQ